MAGEAKRPLKVFLCHASGDKPQVRALYKRLLAEGVDAWLDQEKLLPGQDWRVEIPRAVREADVVVVCLSNNSITKEGYIQKELRFALDVADEKPEGTIFIIPARLEDCPVPDKLSRWHWVDLFEESGYAKLLRSLKKDADSVGAVIGFAGMEESDEEREQKIEQWYMEGLAAYYTEDWDRACQRFQMILREQPNHRKALEKLEDADLQRDLSKLYLQSTQAYQAGNWQAAIQTLDELLKKKPDFRDSANLLRSARQQKQLNDLYTEAKKLHTAGKWQAVVRVFDQIHAIDPNHADTDELLPSAQKELAEIKRIADLNNLYTQGIREMDSGKWYEARSLLEKVHKAQTGYLETERLLRKVEAEIVKIDERNKRNDQINLLYEQAHGLARSKNWRKASEKIEEILKLDDKFEDRDGLREKINAALAQEEQEAQKQNQLAAMYADAVRLLKEEKYQEALDKWHEVRAIDPKYPDRQWVQRTANRKLDELSKPEVAGQPLPKIIRDWITSETNILADHEMHVERLLLLSFALAAISHILIYVSQNWLQIYRWESVPIGTFAAWAPLAGLYGAVVAFALSRTIENWRLKHSSILVATWALGFGISWIINNNLPSFAAYLLGDPFIIFKFLAGLSVIVGLRWAKPATQPITLLIILLGWYLALKAGEILGGHLSPISNFNFYQAAYVLSILFGLLFTFGMQVEKFWEVLKTALFGALGFAVGNFILDIVGPVFLPPSNYGLGYLLWGFIGGAIFEAPSRDRRQILFSALRCGIGLQLGYLATLTIVPLLAGQSYALQFPERFAVLRNISLGIGLGLAFGLPIRRASAIVVLTILGAGMFMLTKPDVLFSADFFITSSIPDAVRGALIGLVLGFGYGYMRNAEAAVVDGKLAKKGESGVAQVEVWSWLKKVLTSRLAIAALLIALLVLEAVYTWGPRTLFLDDFDEADLRDDYIELSIPVNGTPEYSFETMDDASVLRLRNALDDSQRVGWEIMNVFDVYQIPVRIEIRFNPLVQSETTSIDGFFQIYLMAGDYSDYYMVGLYAGNYGIERYFYDIPFDFEDDTWYRLVVTTTEEQNYRVSVYDDLLEAELAGADLENDPGFFQSGMRIGIGQEIGGPGGVYPVDVAIDWIRVTVNQR